MLPDWEGGPPPSEEPDRAEACWCEEVGVDEPDGDELADVDDMSRGRCGSDDV